MGQQEKYMEEYEKYKHIVINPGKYILKSTNIKYEVASTDEANNRASLTNLGTGNKVTKTLHWCRKNLILDEG